MKPTFIALLALCFYLPVVGAEKKKPTGFHAVKPVRSSEVARSSNTSELDLTKPLPNDIPSLKTLAEKGNAKAQYELGEKYSYGREVEYDSKEAVKWYRKAAERGYAKAQYVLGMKYVLGVGVEQDEKKAVKWYRKAAEQEHAEAQYSLGALYARGDGIGKNEKKAEEWTRKAAEQGHVEAQYTLGWVYRHGKGVEQDDKEAVKWYRKAAEQEHAKAQYSLGAMYWYGEGVEKDMAQAYLWMSLAAEQKYQTAREWKGKAAAKLTPEQIKKVEVNQLEFKSGRGSAKAQFLLAGKYYYGDGIEKNKKEAVKWYRKAAEQEYVLAQFYLAGMYGRGHGVEKDEKEAVEWVRKAAEQGHAEAQFQLAGLYGEGDVVEKDEKNAVKWYRKAAKQGHAEAQYDLGWAYRSGEGVRKDEKEAIKWYRKAAGQEHALAQYGLGSFYWHGVGVKKDMAQAYLWMNLAAEQKLQIAREWKGKAAAELTPKQIKRVDKWVKEWSAWKLARGLHEANPYPFVNLEKKLGFRVHWRQGDILLQRSKEFGQAKEVGQLALKRLPDILENALAKYPPWVIQKYLNHVRFAEDLSFGGKQEYGGTVDHQTKSIYVEVAQEGEARPNDQVEGIIHHEFATFLMEVHTFPTNEWTKCNPPDFEYEDPEGHGYNVMGKRYESPSKYWPLGFVRGYSRASLDNDFENFSEIIFTEPRKAKLLIGHFPKLKDKYLVWLKVHQKIDGEFFTEERLLPKNLIDPARPHPEWVKQEELFDLNGTYVYMPTGKPFSGKAATPRDNGKLQFVWKYKAGKLDGIQKSWHHNGQKESETNYEAGKLEGKSTRWYENGKKLYDDNYENGKLEGIRKKWHDNGQQMYEANYKDGKTDGAYIGWHENSQKEIEANYKAGKLEGKETIWYDNGQKEYENIYKAGKLEGIRKKWHANGQLHFESKYKNGEPEGTYTRWYDNGNKKEEGLYRDGKLIQDMIKQWDRDGTPK